MNKANTHQHISFAIPLHLCIFAPFLMKWSAYIPFYKRNLKVAIPVVFTQLGGGIVQLADNIMVGHLGATELAAAAFANSIFIIGLVVAMGSTMGITPLIGQAFVQGQYKKVSELLQNGLLFTLLLGLILSGMLAACIPFMEHMGQDMQVARLARPYFITLIISLLPFLLFCWCKQFLEGLGNTKIAMIITIVANLLNILLNYLFIFGKYGFPPLGVLGAGIATLIARALMPIMFILVIRHNSNWWGYIRDFSREAVSRIHIWLVAKVGLPIGGHMLLECAAFALSSIMVGWLGAIPLAGHQIAQNVWNLAFMVVIGIGSATTIRISHQLGVHDFYALRMAGRASIHLCLFTNTLMAILMIAFCRQIPWIFTNDSAVAAAATPLLALAGLFQFSDGMQTIGTSILRGLTDVKKPVIYAFISYICINLPLSYLLAFPLGLGAPGVWIAFIFGLSIAAILFHRRAHLRMKQLEQEWQAGLSKT